MQPNLPLEMEQFLDYVKRVKSGAQESLKTYRNWLIRFWKWRIANSHQPGYDDPLFVTTEMVLAYRRDIVEEGNRANSARNWLAVVKLYADWLVYTGKIEKFDWPQIRGPKGKARRPLLIIHPNYLFHVRQKKNIRVEAALLLEMLISGGMRISEFLQVWLHEVNLEDRPYDVELGRNSPYVGGSITFTKETHVLKSLPRKVYFSSLAGKLLRRYMLKFGLNNSSRVPLFPWSKRSIVGFLQQLSHGLHSHYKTKKVEPPPERVVRRIIDPQANNRFKLFAERQKQRIQRMQAKLSDNQSEMEVRSSMHPHAFRHAFTNYMFFRSYTGLRGSADSVRLMLGHSSYHELTTYLTRFDLIPDDECWKRIVAGRPTMDWMDLV